LKDFSFDGGGWFRDHIKVPQCEHFS